MYDTRLKKIIKKILLNENSKIENVSFHLIKTNRVWTRDSAPIFLINDKIKKKLFPIFILMLGQNIKTINMIIV